MLMFAILYFAVNLLLLFNLVRPNIIFDKLVVHCQIIEKLLSWGSQNAILELSGYEAYCENHVLRVALFTDSEMSQTLWLSHSDFKNLLKNKIV